MIKELSQKEINRRKKAVIYTQKWVEENPDKSKEYKKRYYQKNRDILNQKSKQWHKDNPEKSKECSKNYYKKHTEKAKASKKKWIENNLEYRKEYLKNYRIINREKIYEYRNSYRRNKNKTDIRYNLNQRIHVSLIRALKENKNGRHWEILVNYTLNDLLNRLQKTMPNNYTWQDFLEGKLHIDHIIPISAFNFTKPEHLDFKRCWALDNLRLLPKEENIRKSNKLFHPFQPALAM